jgi:glycosyltransferase involved in cell wall biosynthesis
MFDAAASTSVIIPTFNRATVVGRAIRSALRQTPAPFEVIVIDDHSSDDSCAVVEAMCAEDSRVRLIRLDRNRGGAAARNAGIMAARGEVLAFLDSDDEWTESHLERKIRLLRESDAGLVFGSFRLHDGRKVIEQRCQRFEGDPLEYLFLARGGFRTSTFVCDRRKMTKVMFDDRLQKHHDWDLMINFVRHFPVATDTQATAILHIDGADRLSRKLNHEATDRFFVKNRPHCSQNGWVLFATVMMERTFRDEGRGPHFFRYLESIREMDASAHASIRSLTPLLRVPRIGGRLFRAACRRYCSD